MFAKSGTETNRTEPVPSCTFGCFADTKGGEGGGQLLRRNQTDDDNETDSLVNKHIGLAKSIVWTATNLLNPPKEIEASAAKDDDTENPDLLNQVVQVIKPN